MTTNTTTQLDLLGRIISTTYDDGLTPSKTFQYDQARAYGDPNSPISLGASKGRLTRELVSAGNGAGQVFGYDPVGRISVVGECRPSTCGITADFMNYSYDWEGNLLTSTDGSGVQSTYSYTRANELRSLTSSLNGAQYPANLLSVATQNQSVNGPLNVQLGNGLYGVNSYDSLGRWNGRWVCSNSTAPGCSGGTQLDGSQVTWQGSRAKSGTDTYLNSGSTFGYDDLNRLTQATVNGTATNYAYDRYGNRTSQTPGPSVPSVMSNNRLQGFQYDAAGNLMQDAAGNLYTYDAEGNVVSINNGSIRYTYDALNQRVRVDEGSSYTEYDFDLAGRRVSEWQGTNRLKGIYYALGQAIGYYDQATTRFQHQDWLGTVRLRTLPNGSVEGRFRQGAFGELQTIGSDSDHAHFAGQDADTSTNTSHATFRQLYVAQGKWMSPDPYGGSYDLSNPQSLNRYSYVLNNPLSFRDPSGLFCETPSGAMPGGSGDLVDRDFSSNEGDCHLRGGTWYPDGWGTAGGGDPLPDPGQGPTYYYPSQGGSEGGGGGEGASGGGGGASGVTGAPSKPTVPSCSSQNLATRTLSRTAAFTHRGLFIGGSLSGSFEPVSVGATVGYYADPSGTVNRVQTYAFSGALGAGVSGGVTFGVSNYKNGGYAGWSDEFNASAGWGPNASATWSRNSDGSGVSLTLGGGAGVSVGGGRSYTVLTPVCKVGG